MLSEKQCQKGAVSALSARSALENHQQFLCQTVSANFNLLGKGQKGRKGHCRDKRDKAKTFRKKGDNKDV